MLFELAWWKHVTSIGSVVGRFAVGFVEGINHELALDVDWISAFVVVKVEPSAEPAFRLSGPVENGVCPGRDDPRGNTFANLFFVSLPRDPSFYVKPIGEVERLTTRRNESQQH